MKMSWLFGRLTNPQSNIVSDFLWNGSLIRDLCGIEHFLCDLNSNLSWLYVGKLFTEIPLLCQKYDQK